MVKKIIMVNNKSIMEVNEVENEFHALHSYPSEVNIFVYIFQDVFLGPYVCVCVCVCVCVFNKNMSTFLIVCLYL